MPDIFGGHERREERRKRRRARLVRFGDTFDSDELEAGTVELEEVDPEDGPEDEGEAAEPWGGWNDKPMPGRVRARLEGYQSFLAEWRRDHPGEDTGEEPEPEETEV